MAASSQDDVFHLSVKKILKSWTVLELAINHGFGGAHSEEKGEWMSYAIAQWFQENEGIESYELEEFLADVLNTEFDTISEDGSLAQISQMICKMYDLCSSGQTSEVMDRLKLLPSPQIRQCVAHGEHSEDEEAVGENRVSCITEEASTSGTRGDNSQSEDAMETEDSNTEEQTDGWTVVKKGKKR